MFAGIVEEVAKVASAAKERGALRVRIEKPRGWKLARGQSVNVDGVCSTVVAAGRDAFDVEYVRETLSKTTAGSLARGSLVNLERSLRMSDRIDGHFVQGHVDGRARVASVEKKGSSRLLTFSIPKNLMRYVAPRGSIALNGVALTIARASPSRAMVALIPYTLTHTNLGDLKTGGWVNVETDLVARYLAAQNKK